MTDFHFCAFITDGGVVMVGTNPKTAPAIPEQDPAPDLVICGTAQGETAEASVLFPLASWDGTNIAIQGVTILTQNAE